MRIHIVTILPEGIEGYIASSLLARAQKKKILTIRLWNPRDFTKDAHKTVDDRPFGGGPGMVLKAEPIIKAVARARGNRPAKIIILSPRGEMLTGEKARALAKEKEIVFIAGRYEGIDARVKKILRAEELSIGPYILAGGELPALVAAECIARHVPGVLGRELSLEEKRDIAPRETYTRPAEFSYREKKYKVPEILRSGHHKNITEFRKKTSAKSIQSKKRRYPQRKTGDPKKP